MARVRLHTYADYAWPAAFGALYRRNGLALALALAVALALFLLLAAAQQGPLWHVPLAGNFYAVFPHGLMVSLFAPVFAFAVLALGDRRAPLLARGSAPGPRTAPRPPLEATRNALALTYLDGGHGEGCNEADDRFTLARRRLHHLTFYGFMLCFAATCVATLYHYAFGWPAPYALDQPAQAARHHRRRDADCSARRACGACTCGAIRCNATPAAARRWTAASSRCCSLTAARAWLLALARHTPALALLLCVAPGLCDGAVPHHAVRQVRARASTAPRRC